MNVSSGVVATGVTAAVAASVVAAVPALQTTVSIDVGAIMNALAEPITIITTAIVAWIALKRSKKAEKQEREEARAEAAKVAKDLAAKVTGVHVLVNDALTREKDARLVLLRGHKVVVETMLAKGTKKNPEHVSLLAIISAQIGALESEIQKRDEIASTLTKEQK